MPPRPSELNLEIIENGQSVFTVEVAGPVELGRQRTGEPEPYALLASDIEPARLLVARQPEGYVSRQHARLQLTAEETVHVANLSPVPLQFEFGEPIVAETSADRTLPFTLVLAGRLIRVERCDAAGVQGLRSLAGATVGPGGIHAGVPSLPPAAISVRALAPVQGWLQTTLGVLQSAIGSVRFLEEAVEAMVSIVCLHSGRVLLFKGESWKVLASNPADLSADWQPSRRVLDRVRQEKRTFWQSPGPTGMGDTPSLRLVQTVLAAPLLHPDGRVIGALYGERRHEGQTLSRPVSDLEAMLVELLACGVAAGLARQEQEQAVLEARVRFEQFFTPELARHLAKEPDLLEGREAEVTLLFADIRGFSRISERLGPAGTVRWTCAVMDELSRHVLAEGGVLVDYMGDELVAMWGAPQAQPDHAERAVRAALALRGALPDLNVRWAETLGEPMGLGIGLNTGPAHVGNVGSRYKFKYGPLGNTVNLASRVQGITKYVKCRLLVTAATRARLGMAFVARRVCRLRAVNIAEPVDLYEVEPAGDEKREQFFRESEAALDALEEREFSRAALAAGTLLNGHPGDGPLRLTLARAAQMLVNEEAPFDPVWSPPGK
jgi:adenylate cyclase